MKRILMILVLQSVLFYLYGQGTTSVKTFLEGDEYTYVREASSNGLWISLYNKENQLTNVDLTYKDTGEKPPFDLREKRVEDEEWSYERAIEIINNAFTSDQKLLVSERFLSVSIYINSTTGKITEVDFKFLKKSPFSQIPLSVFREIEVKLKEEIYFTLTEAGKKVNYVFFAWNHKVE